MPTVLITGFDPFDREPINPSWEAARALDGRELDGVRVVARQLPCVFDIALDVLGAAIAELKPVLVLCVGQAGGRPDLSIERVAINVNDARIPDNAEQQPVDTPIVAGGPAAYFSTLPIKAIVRDLRAAGLPASVSQTAGTFVCNHVFYGLMHKLATAYPGTRGGFVHIPYLPEQAARHAGMPSLALDDTVRGLDTCLRTALRETVDAAINGGATH